MAEDEAPEITSEENPIEEHELELCLGLRPIHPRPAISQNFPEFSDPNPTASLREVQAFRRQEAKRKRELKRKASNNNERRDCDLPAAEDAGSCRKAAKLDGAYSAPAGWWGCNGFRPYQGQNGKITPGWQNIDGENRQSISSGSSSGISDNYQSNSGPGGTSSDVGSHSSHPYSQPSPPAMTAANPPQVQQNGSTPSHLQRTCQHPKSPPSTNSHSQTSVERGPLSEKGRVPTTQTSTNGKVEIGKPPKPKGPTANQQKQMVAQMPCVSVTGNGPNGKTITGFLYRYTTAEVRIVCVCHGASFSPAGFVEHAGGVDVEHPLRHIRVVPFALG